MEEGFEAASASGACAEERARVDPNEQLPQLLLEQATAAQQPPLRTPAHIAAEDAALDAPVVIVKGVLMALSPRGLEPVE